MSLTVRNQTGIYTRLLKTLYSQSIVEIKFGEETGETVSVSPQISTLSCETDSGRANYSGRLVCTLVYSEDGKLCRVQKGAEFSHFADDEELAPAHRGLCTLAIERLNVRREGSYVVVSCVVSARIDVFAQTERTLLTLAEGAEVRKENVRLSHAVPFSGGGEVEDEFDCNAVDVLAPSAHALVLDCSCRAGSVEVSGEIYLSLLAVRENSPVGLERVIPFRCELACEEALLQKKAVCRAEVQDINVTAKVNEDRGRCEVEAVISLVFTGAYTDDEETSCITDAFSCDRELTAEFSDESCLSCTGYKTFTEHIGGLCSTKAKLDYTCAFLAAADPRVEYSLNGANLEGSAEATLVYEQNGEIRSTRISLPFAFPLNGMGECGSIDVAVSGVSVRQRTEGNCEAEAVLKISAADCERLTARYITALSEGAEVPPCDSAVSVYIPDAGDGLWETAKKLRRPEADVTASNPRLTYPLTGKERIVIYRPKT